MGSGGNKKQFALSQMGDDANMKDWWKAYPEDMGLSAGQVRYKMNGGVDVAKAFPKPPPNAPDLTDDVLRQAKAAQLNFQLQKRGRSSSFNQGGLGDPSLAPVGTKSLLGA